MIENIMICPECGLSFEGQKGYTCPHCGKPKMGVRDYAKKNGDHLHTGYDGFHSPEVKHGCVIIAAWSYHYTDIIGGRDTDPFIILKMNGRKISQYKDDSGRLFSGSPETNPRFGKWDSEWNEAIRRKI